MLPLPVGSPPESRLPQVAERARFLGERSAREERLRGLLDRVIEEGVEQWHTVVNDEPHLPSWLGLTESEYAAYVEGGVEKLAATPKPVVEEEKP